MKVPINAFGERFEMPHIVMEYSSNLTQSVDFERLLDALHQILGSFESFETDRIKSRSLELDHYLVGRERDRGLVHVVVSFSRGRSEDLRVEIGQRLLDLLLNEVKPDGVEVSKSIEIRQFGMKMYFAD